MEDTDIVVTKCAIPACSLHGIPWYSEAHFVDIGEDHLLPQAPERIFLSKGLKGERKGTPCIVFGVRYSPALGIPDLDDCVFQAGYVADSPEFMQKVHALERGVYARLAVPDDVIIHLAVQDLRERAARHVRYANAVFLAAFRNTRFSEGWLQRQSEPPCSWAASAIFSAQKTLASSAGADVRKTV